MDFGPLLGSTSSLMILRREAGILALIAPDQADKQGILFADRSEIVSADEFKVVCLPEKIPIGYGRRFGVCTKVWNPWRANFFFPHTCSLSCYTESKT